jgi:pimeloyl-ACP methyl ester carboxylesterase
MSDTKNIICLHGIWMPGVELIFLKHRLQTQHGFQCEMFTYPSVNGTLDENAQRLADFVLAQNLDEVHLIGHSLGGVLALRMLAMHPDMPVTRIICLGSPLSGSRAATVMRANDLGKIILGKTLSEGVVDESASEWATEVTKQHEVGIIAGTISLGIGRIVTKFEGKNDGTVAVAETRLPGAKDHICLPVNHTGLVMSKDVVDQSANFLRRGEFLRES